jgi:hypothetical protein
VDAKEPDWAARRRRGRPEIEDILEGRAMSPDAIRDLPDGTRVTVVWDGGNGPWPDTTHRFPDGAVGRLDAKGEPNVSGARLWYAPSGVLPRAWVEMADGPNPPLSVDDLRAIDLALGREIELYDAERALLERLAGGEAVEYDRDDPVHVVLMRFRMIECPGFASAALAVGAAAPGWLSPARKAPR